MIMNRKKNLNQNYVAKRLGLISAVALVAGLLLTAHCPLHTDHCVRIGSRQRRLANVGRNA